MGVAGGSIVTVENGERQTVTGVVPMFYDNFPGEDVVLGVNDLAE